ncbi:hypothetical protein E8D34_08710 [Nocardioides sp. GY 10113]|uniref:hypothetical protein n=1 Tax=Nocardioides sp. GY 10113 TaxID=2569761 RepID=UPI0010A77FF4|nr:hypothetical protein [Nocardioides sp. GY 10113]TIC87744.1 hypothetical protein E8D34_08710 [Nocardioides sp. GY 10113]
MTARLPSDLIVRPEPANIRVVWPNEAHDFTPWLAANLSWLDETLELGELQLVGTEMPIPGFARNLDILATAADGTRIAIENQYRKVDHDHLTRGLAYAVGHECGALVVIAEAHGREFVAIADYLNHAYESVGAERGIAVFLVELSVQKVGAHFVPRFTVVSRPNTWLTDVHQSPSGGGDDRSVAAFLARCPADFRPVAAQVIEDWQRREGAFIRITPSSASISLDYPYSATTGHTSIYGIYDNGGLGVQRGYYRASVVPDERVEEMDAVMASCFPTLTDKPFYRTARDFEPAGAARFADWLIAVGMEEEQTQA